MVDKKEMNARSVHSAFLIQINIEPESGHTVSSYIKKMRADAKKYIDSGIMEYADIHLVFCGQSVKMSIEEFLSKMGLSDLDDPKD